MNRKNLSWGELVVVFEGEGPRGLYFTFENRDIDVMLSKEDNLFYCDCFYKSNFGINNNKDCKHIKAVKNWLGILDKGK